jgi:hypothetical protein
MKELRQQLNDKITLSVPGKLTQQDSRLFSHFASQQEACVEAMDLLHGSDELLFDVACLCMWRGAKYHVKLSSTGTKWKGCTSNQTQIHKHTHTKHKTHTQTHRNTETEKDRKTHTHT